MIDDIVTDILKAEGWDAYTNDPADRGGPTKWGITQKAWADYRGHPVTEADMKSITEQQARDFYELKYIIEPKFNHLSDMLTPMVVDCGQCNSRWQDRPPDNTGVPSLIGGRYIPENLRLSGKILWEARVERPFTG